ncbi:Alpha/Beta hydrolase protein [Aspergillus heterothallicus]
MSPKSFHINVPDAELERLYQKLDAATFLNELGSAGWDMGVPLSEIKRLTAYWRSGFNWREQEAKLNTQFRQFIVPVSVEGYDGLEVHYLHHISETPGAIPLLFIHGWPGSFIEATKIIPLLTSGDGDKPAFSVIAPSLPNFGFSSPVKNRGFGLNQYAEALHNLMTSLGYKDYVIQGGGWGSFIARTMAQKYPTHTKAIHLNFIPMRFPMPWQNPLFFLQNLLPIPFSSARKSYLGSVLTYLTKGSGYMLQQSTRPQTLGYALHDSPIALLSWIYDKLHSWTDNYRWTDDEILTWEDGTLQVSMSKPATADVKVGVVQFKAELMRYPLSWASLLGYSVRATEYPKGGHFAAWEVPELLASDLREFFGKGGQAYGVVEGKAGFD